MVLSKKVLKRSLKGSKKGLKGSKKQLNNKGVIKMDIKENTIKNNENKTINNDKIEKRDLKSLNKYQKYTIMDNINYNIFRSFKNIKKVNLTKIKTYFYIKRLKKALNDKLITKRVYNSKLKQLAKKLNYQYIINSPLNEMKAINNLAYTNKKLNKKEYDKINSLIKDLNVYLVYNKGYTIKPLKTILGGALIKNKAFIIENNKEISLISWNNKILSLKSNGIHYDLYISTYNTYYKENIEINKELTFNNNLEVDFSLLLSNSTLQHINQFKNSYSFFDSYKKDSPLNFLKEITKNLNPMEFKDYQKDNSKNKMIKIAKYNTIKKQWLFL